MILILIFLLYQEVLKRKGLMHHVNKIHLLISFLPRVTLPTVPNPCDIEEVSMEF